MGELKSGWDLAALFTLVGMGAVVAVAGESGDPFIIFGIALVFGQLSEINNEVSEDES